MTSYAFLVLNGLAIAASFVCGQGLGTRAPSSFLSPVPVFLNPAPKRSEGIVLMLKEHGCSRAPFLRTLLLLLTPLGERSQSFANAFRTAVSKNCADPNNLLKPALLACRSPPFPCRPLPGLRDAQFCFNSPWFRPSFRLLQGFSIRDPCLLLMHGIAFGFLLTTRSFLLLRSGGLVSPTRLLLCASCTAALLLVCTLTVPAVFCFFLCTCCTPCLKRQ